MHELQQHILDPYKNEDPATYVAILRHIRVDICGKYIEYGKKLTDSEMRFGTGLTAEQEKRLFPNDEQNTSSHISTSAPTIPVATRLEKETTSSGTDLFSSPIIRANDLYNATKEYKQRIIDLLGAIESVDIEKLQIIINTVFQYPWGIKVNLFNRLDVALQETILRLIKEKSTPLL
jgi:hypothetical protein